MKHRPLRTLFILLAVIITGFVLILRRTNNTVPASIRITPSEFSSRTQQTVRPASANASADSTVRTNSRPASPLEQMLEALNPDTVRRQPEIDKLVKEMSTADRVHALEQLWTENATGARRELTGELLRKWAEEMPQAAAEWIAAKPSGELQRDGARSVAILWADHSVAEAATWVRSWPDEQKDAGLLAVGYEAARTSPKDALWLASELSPSPARDGLIGQAVREWTSHDPEAPLAWAEKIENSTLREQVFAGAAISLSDTDPAAAADLALQKLPPGGRQDDTVVSIVQRWAQVQPAEAADWVAQFPPGRLRESAVENLVQLWADKDSAKAAQWLTTLEDGTLRDTGLAAYAQKVAPSAPDTALTWAQKITDPDLRARALEALPRPTR